MWEKPISKSKYHTFSQQQGQQSQRLAELKKSLTLNLKAQDRLKKMRDDISSRMHGLDQFISTYRLKTEYPPASRIVSYLKFERSTPHSLKEQSRVIEQQEAIKNSNEDDFQFMKKLNEEKPVKKKKDIDFSDLPIDCHNINFAQLAASCGNYKSGLEVYKAWLDHSKVKPPKRPYTLSQEELIIEKHRMYRDNWQKICQFVETRSFQEIYYEFQNRINPKMKGGRWTIRESIMLIVLLEHYGLKKWAQIAQKMEVKSELQVRERYCNIINPGIGKNLWTPSLESRLLDAVKQHNYSWKQIAKIPCFSNKTDNSIWRKFRNLIILRPREEILDEMRDCPKKDLIEKILNYKDNIDDKKRKAEMRANDKRQQQLKKQKQLQAKSYGSRIVIQQRQRDAFPFNGSEVSNINYSKREERQLNSSSVVGIQGSGDDADKLSYMMY